MSTGKKLAALAGAGAMVATTLLATQTGAGAATSNIPTIVVHANKHLVLDRSHVHAGRVAFRVQTGTGTEDLQLMRLHKGYSLPQAAQDINAAFGGNVPAINRVDKNVSFRGGAEAKPNKPGYFATTLSPNTYLVVNFSNQTFQTLTVKGAAPKQAPLVTSGTVKLLTYGFDTPATLPHADTIHLTNGADQPHFLIMQRVKPNTTNAQLKKAFEGNGRPNFLLKGSTQSGVISPGYAESYSFDVPPGRYVFACFWPDDKTGMVHAAMGMFKLITLT